MKQMSSYSRQQLEAWLKTIEVDGKVLDVGGSQYPLKGRIREFSMGTEYRILDLKEPHKTKQKPDVVLDLNKEFRDELSFKDKDYYEDYFDNVFCLEVMEYIWNPVVALKNMNWFLKKGGILYISFHFLYPHHEPIKEDCLRYTWYGAIKLLEESGFAIEEMEARKFEDMNRVVTVYNTEKKRGLRKNNEIIHNYQGSLIKAIKK